MDHESVGPTNASFGLSHLSAVTYGGIGRADCGGVRDQGGLIVHLGCDDGTLAAAVAAAEPPKPRISYRGPFMANTQIPGEQKKDWVQPSYPTFVELAKDRYLVLFQTRGFGGVDNERAICYQIRVGKAKG